MKRLVTADLDDPRVIALLEFHVETARALTPPESVHALDLNALKTPDIEVFAVWEEEDLLSLGALQTHAEGWGEVKSMHTHPDHRRTGAARMILNQIVALAKERGIGRLNLETGSFDYFAPARALYGSAGFVECPPFGKYVVDPYSIYMTLQIQ